jgi:hypothetical protein
MRGPVPQAVMEGNRLNQSPFGTVGFESSQAARDSRSLALILRD